MDEGKWITVQIRKWHRFFEKYAIDIFSDKGQVVASVEKTGCYSGNLLISPQDKQAGKDVLIQGALRAVTGKNFQVEEVD